MIVKAWGSWELFQSLLSVLRSIGDRHGKSIANIATRWVLDHPFVGAVIIGNDSYVFFFSLNLSLYYFLHTGARLGLSEHPDENQGVYGFHLTMQDNSAIEAILKHSNTRTIITSIGDCGAEYR